MVTSTREAWFQLRILRYSIRFSVRLQETMHSSGTASKDSGVAGNYFASLSHALASDRLHRTFEGPL
jgi:hypothetical protein